MKIAFFETKCVLTATMAFGIASWVLALCLSAVVLSTGVVADGDTSGRLLVAKSLLNEHIVEGKDVTVHYELFNVGTGYVQFERNKRRRGAVPCNPCTV